MLNEDFNNNVFLLDCEHVDVIIYFPLNFSFQFFHDNSYNFNFKNKSKHFSLYSLQAKPQILLLKPFHHYVDKNINRWNWPKLMAFQAFQAKT